MVLKAYYGDLEIGYINDKGELVITSPVKTLVALSTVENITLKLELKEEQK